MGTLLPTAIAPSALHTVLDVACGPGSWSIDLAKMYPTLHITGLDKNPAMVRVAQEDARAMNVKNATFDVGDVLASLPYDDNAFDFIHVQQSSSIVSLDRWPIMLSALMHVLRPGGWLNLVDFEPGYSSSPSIDIFVSLVNQALQRTKHRFSLDNRSFTVGVLFPRLLTQVGCVEITYNLYPVDLGGWNNPLGRAYMDAVLLDDRKVIPFLVKMGVATQDYMDDLLTKMQHDIQHIDYCGGGILISATGRNPPTP